MKEFVIKDRWTIHSYYTLCPYAPDGSGRILASGCDLQTGYGSVYILDANGSVIDCFGTQKVSASFFHTGLWASWGPDANEVYFSASNGNPLTPKFGAYNLSTGKIEYGDGDLEGISILGEPFFYGMHGMLYAAGYGDGTMHPEQSPIPFAERNHHGLFGITQRPFSNRLYYTTEELLSLFPNQEQFRKDDQRFQELGGLTMMVYCVRYSRDGKRLLFHVGNHCVDRSRGEPKLMAIYTADRDLKNIHLALDLSYGKNGVHWSWHPDGEHLIGYGPNPNSDGHEMCLAQVRYDGTDYRMISNHRSGGHPSVSPADDRICVTDEVIDGQGYVTFLNTQTGKILDRIALPKYSKNPREIPRGRNRFFVCHHPVFNWDGSKLLCNQLPNQNASLIELDMSAIQKGWF